MSPGRAARPPRRRAAPRGLYRSPVPPHTGPGDMNTRPCVRAFGLAKPPKGWVLSLEVHQLRLAQHRQCRKCRARVHLMDLDPIEPFRARPGAVSMASARKSGSVAKQRRLAIFSIDRVSIPSRGACPCFLRLKRADYGNRALCTQVVQTMWLLSEGLIHCHRLTSAMSALAT